ncbi:MAG: HAMP domain-containing histidine kinase [Lachnospiraceae bacterium]|nr:HAMP domain-containing histidine kinase [Lachnospiraceae bacterium]MDD7078489.1 HAMP domain-containing sensor histidine kinase [Lachnospiraceae bacterium]
MILNIILAVLLCLVVGYSIYKSRKTYRSIDRLLDCVLNQEKITLSDVQEGDLSALVNKINRIQKVLGKQVELAETEKEQVKSLVSNMSHQLKTPLANLSIYTEILNSEDLDKQKKEEMAEKIKKQIDKLDWIIGSLAKMVKLEQDVISFDAEGISIKKTLLDAIDTVYEKLEKKGILLVSEPYEDILLFHNRKWTVEVFVNLLENAVKYTKRGGTIRIRVCPYEIYTEIQIIDNGCGIREDEITEIFKRFYRSREVEHIDGSGIGLYLSNLILEKEKGYMVVKSVYGEGSCFSVFLQNCKN